MKKKIILIIAVLIVVVIFAALYCVTLRVKVIPVEASALELNPEVIQLDNFSVNIPKGWVKEDSGTDLMMINPVGIKLSDNESAIEYFSVKKEQLAGVAINKYIENFKSFLDRVTVKSEFTHPENGDFINTLPAFYIESDTELKGISFKKLNVMIVEDAGNIWQLNYSVSAENWSKYKAAYYKSVSQFALKQ
ncbi:MAG: hypothetical protein PHN74_00135 [Candidatus Pacebacteria bacterium]|nr:hypothetical protein [Candidatus Paceibacterota bacterium]